MFSVKGTVLGICSEILQRKNFCGRESITPEGQVDRTLTQQEIIDCVCCHLQMLFFKPGVVQVSDYALFWTFPDGSMNKAQLGPPILITVNPQ
jgi:hypothetical protein